MTRYINEDERARVESIEKMSREMEERQVARDAVIQHRRNELFVAVDGMTHLLEDADRLIAEGKWTHQQALDMLRSWVERARDAKAACLDSDSLPSVL